MYELSGTIFCSPAPFGSSFKRTVNTFVLVLIAVTSYSLNSSTGVVAPESEKNEIKSPTLNASPDASASSTAIDVAPAASSETVRAATTCSYASPAAQISTPIELPCVPAVLAAHSP